MSWRQLVRLMVAGFALAMAAFLLSCGGNNSSCGSFTSVGYVPGPCPTGHGQLGPRLVSIQVCPGPAPTATASPASSPSGKASPTPSATPTACPASTAVAVQGTAQFDAIGTFYKQNKNKTFFADITNAAGTGWFSNNSDAFNNGGGVFTGLNPGCTCIYASSGGIQSLPVGLGVFTSPGPAPVCSPCPTLAPTPSPTPTKKAPTSSTPTAASSDAGTNGVVLWSAETDAPVVAMAAGPGGRLYYLSKDGYLYALGPNGEELFRVMAAGHSLIVGSGGTVYYLARGGFLTAMAPNGSSEWKVRVGHGVGPMRLANGGSVIYGGADGGLFSVNADGQLNWHLTFPGLRALAVSKDGGLVAEGRRKIAAFSSDGSEGWSVAPQSTSPLGHMAVSGGAVYVGDGNALYALSLADGTLMWRRKIPLGFESGPVRNADGGVYLGLDGGLETLGNDGSLLWRQVALPLAGQTRLIIGSGGRVAVAGSDRVAFIGRDGLLRWVGARFRGISAMTLSEEGILYVGTRSNHVYAIR